MVEGEYFGLHEVRAMVYVNATLYGDHCIHAMPPRRFSHVSLAFSIERTATTGEFGVLAR
jgi:hypothetical protein